MSRKTSLTEWGTCYISSKDTIVCVNALCCATAICSAHWWAQMTRSCQLLLLFTYSGFLRTVFGATLDSTVHEQRRPLNKLEDFVALSSKLGKRSGWTQNHGVSAVLSLRSNTFLFRAKLFCILPCIPGVVAWLLDCVGFLVDKFGQTLVKNTFTACNDQYLPSHVDTRRFELAFGIDFVEDASLCEILWIYYRSNKSDYERIIRQHIILLLTCFIGCIMQFASLTLSNQFGDNLPLARTISFLYWTFRKNPVHFNICYCSNDSASMKISVQGLPYHMWQISTQILIIQTSWRSLSCRIRIRIM